MSVQTPALSPPAFSCSSTLELGKPLGAPSLASPEVLLPRQEQALWDQNRPQKESLLPPVSPALGGGSAPEQGCQQRSPECSCTGPGSCTHLLCSQVCPSPVMLRCVSPSVTTTTSKTQEINGFSLSVICSFLGLRQPRVFQLLQITSSRAGWLTQK